MTSPRLTLISVNYRTGPFLIRALQSFAPALQRIPHEVIVVDNASGDGSPERIRAAVPHAEVIENPANLGVAKAYNIGLRRARGAVAALLNPDVEYVSGALEPVLDLVEHGPGVGMAGPRITYPDGRIQPSATVDTTPAVIAAHLSGFARLLGEPARRALAQLPPRFLPEMLRGYLQTYRPADSPCDVPWLSAACVFYRRAMFASTGYMHEDFFIYSDDEEFGRRARALGWRSVYHPGLTISHHVGAAGAGNPAVLVERYRSLLLLMKICGSPSQVLATRALLLARFLPATLTPVSPQRRWAARRICRLSLSGERQIRTPLISRN